MKYFGEPLRNIILNALNNLTSFRSSCLCTRHAAAAARSNSKTINPKDCPTYEELFGSIVTLPKIRDTR